MAEQSGFFNSNVVNNEYDRVYLAEHFAKYFASFIGNGVFGGKSDELIVSQPIESGMRIEVLSGMAWINGFWYENTSNLSLDIPVADGVLNRIDNIVIKYGKAERLCWAEVVKGTPATNAVAPPVQRNADYYELKLAEIYVKAGTTGITQAEITDTRLDSEVCGFVVGVIKQFDTTEFGKQLQSYIVNYSTEYRELLNSLKVDASAYIDEYKKFIDGLEVSGTNELNSLFDRLNALIEDGSAFANLVLKVDDVASETALASQTLGYTKKNLIPYPYVDTSKVGNGVTWTDNGNGIIIVNGTTTSEAYYRIYDGEMLLKPGKYKITSGVQDSGLFYVYAAFLNKETGETIGDIYRSNNSGKIIIEVTEEIVQTCKLFIAAYVATGTIVTNLMLKPMICRVEVLDETWEPYRPSVDELISTSNKPGIEYLLAEKWNGNDVYQKTFYVSALPNTSVVGLETGTQWDKIVSINAYALDSDDLTYYPFPIILQGQVTPVAVISKIESDGSLAITTVADVSHLKAYVTIKYTKQ